MAWNIRTNRSMTPALEILVQQVNVDVAASVVLDASTVAPDTNGELHLAAGTPLSKNATTKQYERFTKAAGQVCRGILSADVYFPDNTAKSDLPATMWCHGQWFRADRIVDWATLGTDIQAALPTCKFS